LPPPFDLEAYAKERMSHERELVAPSDRPTVPALFDPAVSGTRITTHGIGGDASLADKPANEDASSLAEERRRVLESVEAGGLGSLDQVPRLAVPLDELRNLSLDHESGFLLSCVDGVSTLDTLLDICGMPRPSALRLLAKLVDYGAIRLEPGEGPR
jgi:hypothetical protein